MAKKAPGPKEAQLKAMREQKAEQGALNFDTKTILNEIAEFKRSKVQPIKDKIQELQAQRREIDQQLNELNRLEAELEGRSFAPSAGKAPGTRRRLKPEQKMDLAKVIFDKMKSSRLNKFSSSDLEDFADGVPVRDLVVIWNEKAEKGEQIHVEGEKRATRYFVA